MQYMCGFFFNFEELILINRLSANTVVVTLTEKVTITAPKFLFSFATLQGKVKNFLATDVSNYTERYNKFVITEVASGSENLLTGSVNLQPEGQWNYKIYAQTSTTNLDPALANVLVEEGIVMVKGTDVVSYAEYDDAPTTTKYYNPEE